VAEPETLLPVACTAILGLGITQKGCRARNSIPFRSERALAAVLSLPPATFSKQQLDVALQSIGIAAIDEDERTVARRHERRSKIACAWLSDHDLTGVARDYGLTNPYTFYR
jgi:hypothetical protein